MYIRKATGTRLDKGHMIPGVNIISGKANVARVNGAGRSRVFLGSKVHLDWPKIDLNAVEIITI